MPPETDTSFDDLEAEMDAIEEKVPAGWEAAVKKMRAELRNKRERYQPLEQAIAGIPEGDRQAFMDIMGTYGQDPVAGAQMMLHASRIVAESTENDWNEWAGFPAPDAAPEAPAGEEGEMAESEKSVEELVEERVRAALEEHDQKVREQTEVQRIQDKLRSLGYDPEDTSDPELTLLLSKAKSVDAKDALDALDKAHEGLAEFYSERAQKYVSQDSADAGAGSTSDEGTTAAETDPSTADAEQSESAPPRDPMAEAEAKARARIDQFFNPGAENDPGV